MKPPDEIKKGLECCVARWAATHFASCKSDCPYWGEGVWCKNVMHSDVSTYIAQLVSDNESKQKRIEELDQMVTMASRQLSLDLGRLEYYADEKKRTDETLSYAHGEMVKLRVELHEAKSSRWELFEDLSTAYYGKQMYGLNDDGTVYSRYSCDTMSFEQAVDEFRRLIADE